MGAEMNFGMINLTRRNTKSKLIDTYEVTDASVHDSQTLDDLLTPNDSGQDFHADSAYTGEEQEKVIENYGLINLTYNLFRYEQIIRLDILNVNK